MRHFSGEFHQIVLIGDFSNEFDTGVGIGCWSIAVSRNLSYSVTILLALLGCENPSPLCTIIRDLYFRTFPCLVVNVNLPFVNCHFVIVKNSPIVVTNLDQRFDLK